MFWFLWLPLFGFLYFCFFILVPLLRFIWFSLTSSIWVPLAYFKGFLCTASFVWVLLAYFICHLYTASFLIWVPLVYSMRLSLHDFLPYLGPCVYPSLLQVLLPTCLSVLVLLVYFFLVSSAYSSSFLTYRSSFLVFSFLPASLFSFSSLFILFMFFLLPFLSFLFLLLFFSNFSFFFAPFP